MDGIQKETQGNTWASGRRSNRIQARRSFAPLERPKTVSKIHQKRRFISLVCVCVKSRSCPARFLRETLQEIAPPPQCKRIFGKPNHFWPCVRLTLMRRGYDMRQKSCPTVTKQWRQKCDNILVSKKFNGPFLLHSLPTGKLLLRIRTNPTISSRCSNIH
jgi:hypothetical protein